MASHAPSAIVRFSQHVLEISRQRVEGELTPQTFVGTPLHQHVKCSEVRDAILGNTGTIISFQLGVPDAEILAKEFYPDFSVEDLINLPNYQIYLKLMIDGAVSKSFSAETFGAAGTLESFGKTREENAFPFFAG
jgi:hypothetical protein